MSRSMVTPDLVCDAIGKAQGRQRGAATPNEEEVGELTRWLNIFFTHPWDEQSLRDHHDAWKRYEGEQAILREALTILQSDLVHHEQCIPVEGWEQAFARSGELLRAAIQCITERCEMGLANPPGFTPRMTGKTPGPWAVMARVIAKETLLAVQTAQVRLGRTPQKGIGDRDGPIVRTVQFWIKRINGTDASLDTIYSAVSTVPNDISV